MSDLINPAPQFRLLLRCRTDDSLLPYLSTPQCLHSLVVRHTTCPAGPTLFLLRLRSQQNDASVSVGRRFIHPRFVSRALLGVIKEPQRPALHTDTRPNIRRALRKP